MCFFEWVELDLLQVFHASHEKKLEDRLPDMNLGCRAKMLLVEEIDVCLDVHIEEQVLHTGHLSPTGVYFEIHVLVKY